ncbi:MAG: Xaa-Pro dipeptidase [Acidobacteriota bacterium]|jgi:Xaa-Pro aminopeptidase|nr:Xaa-Pro dipeptidase [Acidobacteriota bacterium]
MDKNAEIAEKTGRLSRMLAAEGLGGVVLVAQPNFAWLTAGGNNGIDTSREQGACALFVRADGKRFVLASRIEMARLLEEELSGADFEPVEFGWEEEKASPTFLADLAAKLNEGDVPLGSDLPISPNLKAIDGAVARCRYQLTPSELERFRQLGRDAGEVMGSVARSLAPGERESEIARRMSDALAARGMRSVVTLVAADERIAKFRHPVPTERIWERVVMLVTCARRQGLVASLSRIVCAGEVSEELKRRMLASARVNAKLLAATRPDAVGSELYRVAAAAYAEEGFPGEEHLHHQGGAAGYRTRDWVAHPASVETVQTLQAFAWNPTVTGSKVEETCITSAEGVEVITKSPDWPQITVPVEGREYTSPDVLSL